MPGSFENSLTAFSNNFEGYEELWYEFKYKTPKMGNDDDYVDELGGILMQMFVDTLKPVKNHFGGCYRPGTGSSSYYIAEAFKVGASPDGRKKQEPFPANFSPSLNVKLKQNDIIKK